MSATDDYKSELARYLKCFGANVRRLREARQPPLSQEQLAFITGLHRTEIGKIEQGKVEPHLTTLVVLCNGLGAKMDDLVAGLWVPKRRRPQPRALPDP